MTNKEFHLDQKQDSRYILFYRENVHIIVYTANEVEFQETHRRMLNNSNIVVLQHEYEIYYIGNLGNYTVALVKGAVTGQEAYMSCSATVRKAFETFPNTDYLITVGVCGGFKKKIKIKDVVIAYEMINYESQKLDKDVIIDRSQGLLSLNIGNLLASKIALMKTDGFKVHYGQVLSGNKLVSDKNFADKLLEIHPDAIALDMEGYTIARLALEHKLKDWLFIKSPSDCLQNKKNSKNQKQCTQNALTVLEQLLSEDELFQRKRVNVFISGCLENTNPNLGKYEEFVYTLTRQLIKNNFCIKSGYGKCIGNAIVASAYNEVNSYLHPKNISLTDVLDLYPFPQVQSDKIINIFLEQLKDVNRRLLTTGASFSLFIFGEKKGDASASGMETEFSFTQSTFLFPICGTDYTAKKLWDDEVLPNIEFYYPADLVDDVRKLNGLDLNNVTPKQLSDAIVDVMLKFQNKYFTLKI